MSHVNKYNQIIKDGGMRDDGNIWGQFKLGHDQKLRTWLESQVGGIEAMQQLVDAAVKYNTGYTDPKELADSLWDIFKRYGAYQDENSRLSLTVSHDRDPKDNCSFPSP